MATLTPMDLYRSALNSLLKKFPFTTYQDIGISQVVNVLGLFPIPNPRDVVFYNPHHWDLDIYLAGDALSFMVDLGLEEISQDLYTKLIKDLNFKTTADIGTIQVIASGIFENLIMVTITWEE